MEAHQAKLAFFKASTCQHLLEKLVGDYLLLSQDELQAWEDSPEEFGEAILFLCLCVCLCICLCVCLFVCLFVCYCSFVCLFVSHQ